MTAPGRRRAGVPGPRGSPLLGMTPELRRDNLGALLRAMTDHGDVVHLRTGPPGRRGGFYLVTHPDGVQQVLAGGADRYAKDNPFYHELAAAFGDGLLSSDGQRWRRQRRTLAPLFTPRRVARYVAVMAEEAAALARRWDATPGPPARVDLHAEMVEYALRVVGRALFGAGLDDAVPVVRATFPVISEQVRRRVVAPVPPPRRWPTPAQRRAAAARRTLYGVVDAIIEQRRHAAGDHEDLVSLLLAARDPETGTPLDPREVRDQVLVFLLAGHETTATALTFTLDLLGRHAQVQERLQRELDEVLAGRLPGAEDLARLAYTTMVVKEAMRLYPPAHGFGRRTPTGDRIGGHRLPPGSVVVVSPWATHRHPAFWPDPERFDPERFAPEAASARHRYAWFPFGGGPRACIGSHFGMAEAVVATAVLLAGRRLVADPAPVRPVTGITLRPAGPVWCEVAPRVPAAAAAGPAPYPPGGGPA